MECDEAVFQALRASGIPGTRNAWPIGGAPPLPWFTYKRAKPYEVYADNSNYARMRRYYIDLYEAELDDALHDRFEECIEQIGPFSSYETWIPSENCWETSYTITYHYH